MRARLIGAVLAAALLGGVGFVLLEFRPGTVVSDASAGGQLVSGPPAPVSVVRSGNEVTVAGDVADALAKRELLDAVTSSSEDLTVVDRVGVVAGAPRRDFAAAAPVFEAAAGIDDFALHLCDEGTVTLAGTVTDPDVAVVVAATAEDAWPRSRVVDEMVVGP